MTTNQDMYKQAVDAKNTAYRERNALVAALSKLFPSGLGKHDPSDESWDREWLNIVFIDLPTGQASWHLHDSDMDLFRHLIGTYNGKWDGHSTNEKYKRIAALSCQTREIDQPLTARETVAAMMVAGSVWHDDGSYWYMRFNEALSAADAFLAEARGKG